MSKGYTTVPEVRSYLGLNSDANINSQISTYIDLVEELVDQYCQTTFLKEDGDVKIFNGTGTEIIVPGYFLRTLTKVEVLDTDNVVIDELTDVVMMPDEPRQGVYRWLERRPFTAIDERNVFPLGLKNIKVTGDWGFSTYPVQFKLAIALGIQHCWNMRDFNEFVQQEIGAGRSVFYNDLQKIKFLPTVSRKILDSFMNTRMFSI